MALTNPTAFQRAASKTKLTGKSVKIAYDRLIVGMTLRDVARKHFVTQERVRQNSARVERAWKELLRDSDN